MYSYVRISWFIANKNKIKQKGREICSLLFKAQEIIQRSSYFEEKKKMFMEINQVTTQADSILQKRM